MENALFCGFLLLKNQNKTKILHCQLIKNYIFVPVTKNFLQCQKSQQE